MVHYTSGARSPSNAANCLYQENGDTPRLALCGVEHQARTVSSGHAIQPPESTYEFSATAYWSLVAAYISICR